MWALLPPKPNPLTPANRRAGVPGAPAASGQGSSFCTTRSGSRAKGISGLGVWKCRLGGSWRCFRASAAFIRLATPDAVSMCPMFVFTEPIAQTAAGRTALAEHAAQRHRLNGIAQSRTRALRFHELDLPRRDFGAGVGLSQDLLLGRAAGGGQPVAGAVLIDGAAADYGVDRVTVLRGPPPTA